MLLIFTFIVAEYPCSSSHKYWKKLILVLRKRMHFHLEMKNFKPLIKGSQVFCNHHAYLVALWRVIIINFVFHNVILLVLIFFLS